MNSNTVLRGSRGEATLIQLRTFVSQHISVRGRPWVNTANICAFGWKARDFALKGVDGKTYSLVDVRGPNGTLIVFICNHCPYVKASIDRIVAGQGLAEIGIGTIAIMPNDTDAFPEDSFENMKRFSAQHDFTFPYVIDHTQDVARAYGAQCTPDFFGFNFQR